MSHVLLIDDEVNGRVALSERCAQLKAEIGSLRGELRRLGRFGRLLGMSSAMQRLYDEIEQAAPSEEPMLIIGENGTERDLVAQTICDLSGRAHHPFVMVSCAALSPQSGESELFGGEIVPGERVREGFFEHARGGTVFLDEITELPHALQVALLRRLNPAGGAIAIDVRIIAGTNRDPAAAFGEDRWQSELYQRLGVFVITIPPLRERSADVEFLAQHFLDELNAAQSTHKSFPRQLSADLSAYHWPGNVRELRNCVQRLFIMADDEPSGHGRLAHPLEATSDLVGSSTLSIPIGTPLAEVDRQLILSTLRQCGGVKKRAADVLGISLKTLYNRLEEYRPRVSSLTARVESGTVHSLKH